MVLRFIIKTLDNYEVLRFHFSYTESLRRFSLYHFIFCGVTTSFLNKSNRSFPGEEGLLPLKTTSV